MSVLLISTFNAVQLESYGRRMIETVRRHMPKDVRIRIYTDGWDASDDRVTYMPLSESSPWLADFKRRHARKPTVDFRMDAVRFSHKIAAVTHAAKEPWVDYLIWLDGDSVMHADMSMDDLAALAPNEQTWISWLTRKRAYPECGFYILNCNYEGHSAAISVLEKMYSEDRLFALRQWHDSFVLESVVQDLQIPSRGISGQGYETHHPLINSPLGKYFDHLKGKRKVAGHSHRTDLLVPRGEDYWRKVR